jgi:tRNA1Val (adenine37-N6)-methyltransferase
LKKLSKLRFQKLIGFSGKPFQKSCAFHYLILKTMANSFFQFKQFKVAQDACAMKVCTDACLFGAWCAMEIKQHPSNNQIALDIGTGTGLLSLMIRQKHALQIDAIEIDEAAAAQAFENVRRSPWPEAIHVLQGDVLNMGFSKSYDYIICNPPFYQNELQSPDNKRNVAHHSSRLTLPALVAVIKSQLKLDGVFFLLLPYKRREETRTLLEKTGLGIYKEMIVRQTAKHAPFRLMLKGGFEKKEVETNIITIATDHQHYTPQFTALLQDYYLYL